MKTLNAKTKTKPKTAAKQKKVTLADMRMKPYKCPITIPGESEPCTWILIKSARSDEFMKEAQKVAEAEDSMTDIEAIRKMTADLIITICCGWEEEVFGPYSEKAMYDILLDSDYYYVPEQIGGAAKNQHTFFSRD